MLRAAGTIYCGAEESEGHYDDERKDPRQFSLKHGTHRLLALTSLSWLLPVELTPDGREIVRVHYDHAIEPAASYQEYGVEDARICRIDNVWYMTTAR